MDQIIQTVEPVRQFAKDSIRLVKRCTKPDKKGMIYVHVLRQIQIKMSAWILVFTHFSDLQS